MGQWAIGISWLLVVRDALNLLEVLIQERLFGIQRPVSDHREEKEFDTAANI
jgi:hypothetical protein